MTRAASTTRAVLMQPLIGKEEDTYYANLYSAIAEELRKVATSL